MPPHAPAHPHTRTPQEEIYSSSYAAAAYLDSIHFDKSKKVYVIGETGILEELDLKGIPYLGGPADGQKVVNLKPGEYMEHDKDVSGAVVGGARCDNLPWSAAFGPVCVRAPCSSAAQVPGSPSSTYGLRPTPSEPARFPSSFRQVGAVVVGFDRYINYYKIQYATLCIRENPGCLFIATNRDAVTHLTDAQEWAGNGSMVGAIAGSTKREPHVVGKPSDFMLKNIAEQFNLKPSQICMVGDRLDTDILFGQNGGLATCLVLSGVTTEEQLLSPKNEVHPDLYMGQLSDLMEVEEALKVTA